MDVVDLRRHPVLVVDDEPDILRAFRFAYEDAFDVLTAVSGPAGLALLADHDVGVVVADQRMPGMTGTAFLEHALAVRPDAVRIVLTGYTDVQSLVDAVNAAHIWRYVTKPWDDDELRLALVRAMETFSQRRESQRLIDELRAENARLIEQNGFLRQATSPRTAIVGDSAPMRAVRDFVAGVAPSRDAVLLEGETGTGKELVARAIHAAGPRRNGLFVVVSCATLPERLLEAQIFGARRGEFSFSPHALRGAFAVAAGGTLFLEQIDYTWPEMQEKLLHALEEGTVTPLGDDRPQPIDVRVITASSRPLADAVAAGHFRADLYAHLQRHAIVLPPLRERPGDVEALSRHLIAHLAARIGALTPSLAPEALAALERYAFPGNVRELKSVLERAVLLVEPGAPITGDLLRRLGV